MILMCPCIIDFIGGMDYKGEWGGGRGWTGIGRPGEDVGGQVMADQERT